MEKEESNLQNVSIHFINKRSLTILYVRLVSVQEISVVIFGTKEKVPLSTRTISTLVVQVPRRLNQLALGFELGSEVFVFIIERPWKTPT